MRVHVFLPHQIFQEPLERPQQRGGPILSHEDSKNIFGNTPEILAVHQRLVVSCLAGGTQKKSFHFFFFFGGGGEA